MLGDVIETALTTIGITGERVEKWIGQPCGCVERRDKLNALSNWAIRVLSGKRENAATYLDKIIEEDNRL